MPSSTQKLGVMIDEMMIEQVERRDRRPDLDEALEEEVGPAAEIALQRAGDDADHRRDAGQDEAEQHRQAEAVDEPRDDVAALVVGAEPVPLDVAAAQGPARIPAAGALGGRAALLVGEHPGRRRGGRHRQVEIVRGVGEADRRPDRPAVLLDLLADDRVAVIGAGQEAAELLLRVVDENGDEPLALVAGEDRPVVGDELGEQAQHEQDREDPERPVAAPVGAEVLPAPAVDGRELDEALARQGRGDGRRRRRSNRHAVQLGRRVAHAHPPLEGEGRRRAAAAGRGDTASDLS